MDENAMEFHTYLPVQLDATCNGFQHMALLSNEDTLFKELNLVSRKSNKKELSDLPPSDFYNFLLHKIVIEFKNKLDVNETIDSKTKGSYERLYNFI